MARLPRLTCYSDDGLWDDPLYEPTVDHLVDTINDEVEAALGMLERLQLEADELVALVARINERTGHPALQHWRRLKRRRSH